MSAIAQPMAVDRTDLQFDNSYNLSRNGLASELRRNPNMRKNLIHSNDKAARKAVPGCRGRLIPGTMIAEKLDDYICGRYGPKYIIFAKEFTASFSGFFEPGDSVSFLISDEKFKCGFLFGKVEAFKNGKEVAITYQIKLGVVSHS
ncbi:MAG: hypothetical protein Q7K33_02050 [Candidatus Berkelbacteria bacterium]|nr:hypothetical protein [Candidatus Berkelbacteria bacterium]